MKEYIVSYIEKGLPCHDRMKVYAEDRRSAKKTVRQQFGRGGVKIEWVKLSKNVEGYNV